MGVQDTYQSLLSKTARDIKNEYGPVYGPPSNRHILTAKVIINNMSNTQLLEALSKHEEDTQ